MHPIKLIKYQLITTTFHTNLTFLKNTLPLLNTTIIPFFTYIFADITKKKLPLLQLNIYHDMG